MPLAGTFQQYPLPDVMELIESGQRTGKLVAHGASRVAHIYFANGRWVHAERLGMGLTLAEQLVQAGLLTQAQLAQAFSLRMDDTLTLADDQFVRMLTSSGLLTLDQIREWATTDAVSMLGFMLSWTDGEFTFEDGVPMPAGELALPLPLGQLVTQALQSARGNQPIPDVTPLSPEMLIAFTDIDPASTEPIRLTRDQWRLLSEVDGQKSLATIADLLHGPESVLLHVAAELVALDLAIIIGREP
jgi:hypothetical protein